VYYELVDVNPYFYNCGHYPLRVVEIREGEIPIPIPTTRRGTPLVYVDKEAAEEAASRLNSASSKSWYEYLNG
jgi:hypothetical protein